MVIHSHISANKYNNLRLRLVYHKMLALTQHTKKCEVVLTPAYSINRQPQVLA